MEIKLLIRTDDGNEIAVDLEPYRVNAVVKFLGLDVEDGVVVMNRRKWKRKSKNLISDKQLSLFGEIES
jgi:hypothetical protein